VTEQQQGTTQPVEDDRRDGPDDGYEALHGGADDGPHEAQHDGRPESQDGTTVAGTDGPGTDEPETDEPETGQPVTDEDVSSEVGPDDEAVVLSGPASQRLAQLGLALPQVPVPVADYVPAVRTGTLVYTSGQLPFYDGVLSRTGVVGDEAVDVTPAEAAVLARQCALNAVAAVASVVDLDSVVRVVKVTGFVASAPGFGGQPVVVDGASQLLGQVFGDAGAHARSAVGVAGLPLGAPVEVEIVVEVR